MVTKNGWSVVLAAGLVPVVLWLMACGGPPPPQDQLTAAQAAIRAAEVGGAPEHPKAALKIKNAQDQIAQAKALIAEGKHARAERLLRRAELDAELGLSMAREEAMKAEVAAARAEVEKLKAEQK